MAATQFGTNDPQTRKAWSKRVEVEGLQKTYMKKFMGPEGSDSLIVNKSELKKGKGDDITCALFVELVGDGVEGDTTLKGKEESLDRHNQTIKVNQLRHAVNNLEGMTTQRTPFNLRKIGKDRLSNWYADRCDTVLFNHLAGNARQTDGRYTGHNTITAPTSERWFKANGKANDENLVAADKFTLEMIDYAVEKARTSTIADGTGSPISPVSVNGEKMFVCFIHEYQLTDLRTTSAGRWRQIQDALLAASTSTKNPIFSGAAGLYNNTILHATSRAPTGTNSSSNAEIATVRRAVFCGANAAMMATGGSSDVGNESAYSWSEETDDYGNQYNVAMSKIWGVKKSVYTPAVGSSQDHAAIVLSSYAAAHTGA